MHTWRAYTLKHLDQGEHMLNRGLALHVAGLLLAVAATTAAHADFADDLTIIPSIGIQLKQLKFDEDLFVPADGPIPAETVSGSFDADVPSYTVGLTVGYKRGYVALKYEDTLSSTSASSQVPFTNRTFFDTVPVDVDIEREDFSATFGMRVVGDLNVFAGYMKGETVVKPDRVGACLSDPFLDLATNCAFGGNLALVHFALGREPYEQIYEEDGWFVGVSYAWVLGDAGALSVGAAWANLDGTYEDNFLPEDNEDFDYRGDADGLSLSITWTGMFTDRVGYFIDLRRQQYEFDGKDKSGNFPGWEVETEETIVGLTAGIRLVL